MDLNVTNELNPGFYSLEVTLWIPHLQFPWVLHPNLHTVSLQPSCAGLGL